MWLILPLLSLLAIGSCLGSSAVEYPSKGFIYGKQSQHRLAVKVQSYHSFALTVQSLQFDFLPTAARFLSPTFELLPQSSSYERPVWSNGREYLYFIQNPSDHDSRYGTWLIGREIGVDSGYAFLKPNRHGLIPLGLDQDGGAWHFLESNSWKQVKNMTLSTSSPVESLVYYEVEYLTKQTSLTSSILLASPPSNKTSPSDVIKALGLLSSPEITAPSADLNYPAIWSPSSQSWRSFSPIYSIPYASPVILSSGTLDTKKLSDTISRQESIGHLINDESLETGWRLTFRRTDSGNEVELMLALDSDGLQDGYMVTSASASLALSSYQHQLTKKFDEMSVGDYSWVWLTLKTPLLGIKSPPSDTAPRGQETINLILKCVSREEGVIVFEYFHSDRRDAMSRTILSHAISYFIAKRLPSSSSSVFPYQLSFDGRPVDLLTIFSIGSNPTQWIVDHLMVHEGVLSPSISSCFMYHAGTTLPQQFIYAAEIICFLLGAKPITMVRHDPSSLLCFYRSLMLVSPLLSPVPGFRSNTPLPQITNGNSH
jgi:hypothetical protein